MKQLTAWGGLSVLGGGEAGWGSLAPVCHRDTEREDLTVIYVAGWPTDGAETILLRTRAMYRDRRERRTAEQFLLLELLQCGVWRGDTVEGGGLSARPAVCGHQSGGETLQHPAL